MENNEEILNQATDYIAAQDYILAKDLLQKVINDELENEKSLLLAYAEKNFNKI